MSNEYEASRAKVLREFDKCRDSRPLNHALPFNTKLTVGDIRAALALPPSPPPADTGQLREVAEKLNDHIDQYWNGDKTDWRVKQITRYQQELGAALAATSPVRTEPVVTIKPMLSDGRTDYFVSIKIGGREVTPHMFREEYKAAYHVALYSWLLSGTAKPNLVEFGPDDWPAIPSAAPLETPCRAALEIALAYILDFADPAHAAATLRMIRTTLTPPKSGGTE